MKAKYIKEHNNYDLTLGKTYKAKLYKIGWLLIKDDRGQEVLFREECFERDEYSTDEAADKALIWCEKNPGWKRICDLEGDSSELYKTWEELSKKEQKSWIREYGELGAKDAWEELGHSPCKVPFGFISGKGEFYDSIIKVPSFHNLMQVYKVG
jgi:hypothetical protein